MLETLKIHLKESQRPVGVKRSNKIKIPSEDHVYGYQVKKDPEGCDKSKSKKYFNHINFKLFQL